MQKPLTLINLHNGNLAFKVTPFDNGSFDHIQRYNYYSIVWLKKGTGLLRSDFNEYELRESSMMFFTPYQPFMLKGDEGMEGVALHFHPDFFCIYHHDKEVSCNGILFNNIYKPPYITVGEGAAAEFNFVLEQIREEMKNADLLQYELLVSYLKIFMIKAVRIKSCQNPELAKVTEDHKEPFVLQQLMEHIEENFQKERQPGYYASLLSLTPKALGKITKQHFNKTLTDLIAERIIIEAKRELYLTSKPVKAIAYELGFEDEFYFSRYFKNHTDVSPQGYRDTVGVGVAEKQG
jgi:AraC family transcriptional regulator, transcriptional activator of pobA